MKKSILLIVIGLIAITVKAQKVREHDVPNPVKQLFTDTYPRTEVEEWRLKDGNYEAEFEYNKKDILLLISAGGQILQTGTGIESSELPASVNDYISKNAAGKTIEESYKMTDAKGTVTYRAEVKEENYLFDSAGTFISKETVSH